MFKTVEKINFLEEWKRLAKEKGKNNRIENDEREARKSISPSIKWHEKVRGDGLGKRETKTILTMTYLPSFLFVAPNRYFSMPPQWFLSLDDLAHRL